MISPRFLGPCKELRWAEPCKSSLPPCGLTVGLCVNQIYTHTDTYTRTHTHTHLHTHPRTRTHLRTHPHTCARTHARTHPHTRTRTHTNLSQAARVQPSRPAHVPQSVLSMGPAPSFQLKGIRQPTTANNSTKCSWEAGLRPSAHAQRSFACSRRVRGIESELHRDAAESVWLIELSSMGKHVEYQCLV